LRAVEGQHPHDKIPPQTFIIIILNKQQQKGGILGIVLILAEL